MKKIIFCLILATSVFLQGMTKFSETRFGITPEELREVIGEPDQVLEDGNLLYNKFKFEEYNFQNVKFNFEDGKLVYWKGQTIFEYGNLKRLVDSLKKPLEIPITELEPNENGEIVFDMDTGKQYLEIVSKNKIFTFYDTVFVYGIHNDKIPKISFAHKKEDTIEDKEDINMEVKNIDSK